MRSIEIESTILSTFPNSLRIMINCKNIPFNIQYRVNNSFNDENNNMLTEVNEGGKYFLTESAMNDEIDMLEEMNKDDDIYDIMKKENFDIKRRRQSKHNQSKSYDMNILTTNINSKKNIISNSRHSSNSENDSVVDLRLTKEDNAEKKVSNTGIGSNTNNFDKIKIKNL
jgi:hypothetical protein